MVVTSTGYYYINDKGQLKYGISKSKLNPEVQGFKGTRNYILNIFNYLMK
jgi:hypothetical protein